MNVEYEHKLLEKLSQELFGELRTSVSVTITDAEVLAKKTKNMYFKNLDQVKYGLWNCIGGLYEQKKEVEDALRDFVLKTVKKTKKKEVEVKLAEILDFKKLNKMYEQHVEEEKRIEEERKRKEELWKRINEWASNQKYLHVGCDKTYDGVKVEIYLRLSDSKIIRGSDLVHVNTIEGQYEEVWERLQKYSVLDAYRKYTEKLREENKELKQKLEATKEEIVKELYAKDETITVEDDIPVTRTLKVVAEEDEEDY